MPFAFNGLLLMALPVAMVIMPEREWFAKKIAQSSAHLLRRKTQAMLRIDEALQRRQVEGK